MLKGKKILLGITGSIAAYKSVFIVRELIKAGAEVRVICTKAAFDFVTPITLATLSKHPVISEFVTDRQAGTWANHVELAKWADLMLIAPLSANTLSKMVTGQCDNVLLATYLSATCPMVVAPAMDLDMFAHWTTTQNLEILRSKGVDVIDAESGELASGLHGKGRMAEPETIIEHIRSFFERFGKLNGKRILVTAGPTYEPIDPVRFIGNHSSGKMGVAIANEAAARGAQVTLIIGPTWMKASEEVQTKKVTTALEMFEAVKQHYEGCDAVIMAAAVADYRPKNVMGQKHKKEQGALDHVELEETDDILKYLGQHKSEQRLIGFALETENALQNARKKLENKNLDMLVMNTLQDEGAGFGTDTNKVTFVHPGKEVEHSLKDKSEVARDILDALEELL